MSWAIVDPAGLPRGRFGGALRPQGAEICRVTVVRGRFREKRDSGPVTNSPSRKENARKAAGRRLPRRWGPPRGRGLGPGLWGCGALGHGVFRRDSGYYRWRVPEVSERRRCRRGGSTISFLAPLGLRRASHPGRPAPRCGAVCGGSQAVGVASNLHPPRFDSSRRASAPDPKMSREIAPSECARDRDGARRKGGKRLEGVRPSESR